MRLNFHNGDQLEMKKPHPCGGKKFSVLFAGSDVKIRCLNCGREVVIPRVKLENNIKRILSGVDNAGSIETN